MTRELALTVALCLSHSVAAASDFVCIVSDGSYKPPGVTAFRDAGSRDPSIIGRQFKVNRVSGEIVGEGLVGNHGRVIEVLGNLNGILDHVEIISKDAVAHGARAGVNRHSDVHILTIDRFEGKYYFKYYFSWLGLLLTGECRGA